MTMPERTEVDDPWETSRGDPRLRWWREWPVLAAVCLG